ncbi:MAG: DUF1579 domain-containing protein [Verrucomicrobiaceae bacterium]|nr:MAG: DUF1579 domain-containing protein [Verrucomicrobiaceae bacterium]
MSTETTQETNTAPCGADLPPPVAQHEWLRKFVGEWTTEAEILFDPAAPPMKSTGRDSVRMLGGFWLLSETTGDSTEMPYSSVLSVGYDPEKGKYIGTWMDSMMPRYWSYEGTANEAGNKLTLETKGPCPKEPGKIRTFHEALELTDADHKVFTSSILNDDGTWTTCVTVKGTRVK